MHIAIVTRNMGAGGAERVIAQLIKEWTDMGIRCSLVSMNPEEAFYSVPETVACYDIPHFSDNSNVDKIRKYAHLRGVIKTIAPDVVLSLPEEIGIYVLPALMGTGIPVVVSERNNPAVMPYKKISRIMRRVFYPFSSGLIFQTEQAASFFPASQQKKGIILPNPLDCSRLPEVCEGQREKVVVSAGRMEPQKNFPLLIQAFARFHEAHPDYRLVIYGDGSRREELESLAAQALPEGSWSMPGKVSDLPARVGKSGIFALSSDYEGVPNVLIEAMAVGTPSVSTDCAPGGAASLIEHGKNGLLVPVGDADALAQGLSEMADHPEQAEAMGQNAAKLREELDSHKVSAQWLRYLTGVKEKKQKKLEGIPLPGRSTAVVRYQPVLAILFVILTILSGCALVANDSTLSTDFTLAVNRYATYACILGIMGIYLLSAVQWDLKYTYLLLPPILYWCFYLFDSYSSNLPVRLASFVILCLFVLLRADNKRLVYEYHRKVLVVLSAAGIVCYVLYLAGLDGLFAKYDYYSANIGGNYYSYGVGWIYFSGEFARLCGYFNEPGFLGTVLGLLLCVENLNLKKAGNVCLLIAGCMTFSLAFYLIVAAYLVIKCIPVLIKKPVLWVGVAALALFYLFVFPHIRTGNETIDALLQRFVLTKEGLAGDNRSTYVLDTMLKDVLSSKDLLFGRGSGYVSANATGVLSYKTYLVEYGVIGFAAIFGSLLFGAVKLAGRNYNALAVTAVFALSIYQRPHVVLLLYFVILYGGIESIRHREKNPRQKESAR